MSLRYPSVATKPAATTTHCDGPRRKTALTDDGL